MHDATRQNRFRLFIAMVPDDDVRDAMAERVRSLRASHASLQASWVAPARYHATALFLGEFAEVPDAGFDVIRHTVRDVPAQPVTWVLDRFASFPGRRPPCFLTGSDSPPAFRAWWRYLAEAVKHVPGVRHEQHFVPHVTVAYAKAKRPDASEIAPIRWQVGRLALLRSFPGESAYEILVSRNLAD
ncbi:2'-5' RNA ligase family protein [Dyella terrae]|nr:2'-5' RNA ligase family protein [Dyella terrae]TBR39773.1 hypothetical protein EYV96_06185 [Dyella terrae]